MSLVHEALRKAERERQRKLGVSPPAPPAPVSAPAPPPPVVATAITPVVHQPAVPKSPPPAEEPPESNHFLLPALIGCVAIVAIIAIVFLVSNATTNLRQSRQDTPPPALTSKTIPAKTQAATTQTAAPADAMQAVLNIPKPAPPTDEEKYQLSGIMKDPDGKPVAVLNGRVVYEGYYVDGATVEKIETDRITVTVNDRKIVLRLF